MSLFLSCGEPSGDAYLSHLAAALREMGVSSRLEGMVGPRAQEAGVRQLWDCEAQNVVGLTEAISVIPALLRIRRQMAEWVRTDEPEAVVVVDSPDFHLPLARAVRRAGYRGPLVYLIPPTFWAWRPGRLKPLRRYVDCCLPLFAFEHRLLLDEGVPSRYLGHPLLEERSPAPRPPQAPLKRIALLPGSRRSEVRRLGPLLTEVGRRLQREGYAPVLSVSPSLAAEDRERLSRNAGSLPLWEGPGRELIASSDMVAGASGTAAVEALLADRFMVVAYTMSPLTAFLARPLIKTPYVAMPNILAGERLYPEYTQGEATPEALVDALKRYAGDDAYRRRIHAGLAEARKQMGSPGAYRFWAETICSLTGACVPSCS
ncbi:MAG: lipid-A-disaccharide synthase [Synergistales bacterium]|nr:lipid-A-disaccharide synthase [Synergistales bacterium]